jgi:hypothetical protein
MTNSVYIEALAVGILTAVFGTLLSRIIPYSSPPFILLSYFIVGFLIHLFCQITRINKWYCTNGNACNT